MIRAPAARGRPNGEASLWPRVGGGFVALGPQRGFPPAPHSGLRYWVGRGPRRTDMPTLLRSNHFLIQHYQASGYLLVVRSAALFESAGEANAAFDECRAAVAVVDAARQGILFDWRKSPISTDPALHKALAENMDALAEPFARRAILLATPVGTMQAARVGRAMGNQKMLVFNHEGAAVEFVTHG